VSSHGEVPPTVEILGDGTSVVFYTVALPGQWVGEIHMQRSTDGGSSWSAPVAVHDDEKRASHSFFSTHLQNDGRIVVAWLDGRGGKPAVYATTTSDGLHVEPNGLVDEKACECCGTELETSSDGSVLLAYRDLEQDNVRDIALASARPSSPWRRLGKVSNDNWSIEACPHSGARLTRTGDGSIWAAWSSGADGSLFVAASRDGGKTFSARQRIGGGQGRLARHPEIAELSPGRIIIAYERPRVASSAGHGGHDTRSEIVTRIFDGRTWSAEHDLGDGSYPRIARSATGTVLSFTRWRAHSPSIVVRDLLE
jgi:hypothetical protein